MRIVLSVVLAALCLLSAPNLTGAQDGAEQPRDMNVYLQAPMRPDDPRVAAIKLALDALPGIADSTNVYGNRITLTPVGGQTVALEQIQSALHGVDPAVNLDVVKLRLWGPWVIKFRNYDQAKDPQLLENFRGIGSAVENVRLVAPGTFAFTAGGLELRRFITRNFADAAFGPSFDRERDPADFIQTWVWGGTTAP